MERMNYINKDKNYMTDAERIRYLEESIRELRKEKENLKKEKGELKARLEEENKKLKKEREMLIEDLSSDKELQQQIAQKQVDYYRENQKLKEELKELEETLEHRDSVLSIMYDLLRSDLSDYEQLCMIDVVIDVEVGNEPQNKLREELLDRFWKRDF